MNNGPGRGLYSMETVKGSKTEQDIWENFLSFRPDDIKIIWGICGVSGPNPEALENNIAYHHFMARVDYLRAPDIIPPAGDIQGQANYWDQNFNKNPEKGFPADYMKNYRIYVLKRLMPGGAD